MHDANVHPPCDTEGSCSYEIVSRQLLHTSTNPSWQCKRQDGPGYPHIDVLHKVTIPNIRRHANGSSAKLTALLFLPVNNPLAKHQACYQKHMPAIVVLAWWMGAACCNHPSVRTKDCEHIAAHGL